MEHPLEASPVLLDDLSKAVTPAEWNACVARLLGHLFLLAWVGPRMDGLSFDQRTPEGQAGLKRVAWRERIVKTIEAGPPKGRKASVLRPQWDAGYLR